MRLFITMLYNMVMFSIKKEDCIFQEDIGLYFFFFFYFIQNYKTTFNAVRQKTAPVT